ncbi:MAG: hypothetical protein QM783_11425 [Phycisphaerales bacterium]
MRPATALFAVLLTAAAAAMTGCGAAAQAIAINEYYNQKEGSHTVDAEYRGLPTKSFVVLVSAPTALQADRPGLTAMVSLRVSADLAEHAGASGFVPGDRAAQYQFNHPNWIARPMGDVAKDLGVQRVIHVDFTDYRLREPGNQYVWDGVATATVAVYETDTTIPDDPAFQKIVRVVFPDEKGRTPAEFSENVVNTELTNRLSQRTSWLFYSHDEKNALKY